MAIYGKIVIACWVAFLLVWTVLAFNVKRDIQNGQRGARREYWILRLVVAWLLVFFALRVATGTAHYTNLRWIFSLSIFPKEQILGWISAIFAVVGICVAIWARVYLGRNWSSRPAVKEGHELVTTGPYAYVRHPIYTGVILMALGTALSGATFGIWAFVIASFVFVSRIEKEEKIMRELFPGEYPEYQKRTKRLIPLVW